MLERHVLPEARLGEQLLLDERADLGGLIGDRALVEVLDDGVGVLGEERGGDLAHALGEALAVQLATHQAENRGRDLELGQIVSRRGRRAGAARAGPGDEAHDLPCHVERHEVGRRLGHHRHGLVTGHLGQPQPILHDGGHALAQTFELRQVVLAEAEQDPTILPVEGEGSDQFGLRVQSLLERARGTVLDEVADLGEEGRAPEAG